MRALLGLFLLLNLSGFAYALQEPSKTSLCVNNQSGVSLFFVLELGGGPLRVARPLENDTRLCLEGQNIIQSGTIAVFEDQFAIEGCTRLAQAGQSLTLLRYVSFDNCTWQ